jgi:hypothetical protein
MAHEQLTTKRPTIEQLQREREHLEKLFSDRINFYLVFAAGVFIFLLDKNPGNTYARPILICIFLISVAMLLALLRTFLLVKRVLNQIRSHQGEVYSELARGVWFHVNANVFLIFVPFILCAYFGFALVHSLIPGR